MKPLLLYILLIMAITLEAALISDDFPNSYYEATTINFTTDVNGTLSSAATDPDEDWFTFTLEKSDGVILSGKADADTAVTLYTMSSTTFCTNNAVCVTDTVPLEIESFTMSQFHQVIFAKNLGLTNAITTFDINGNPTTSVSSSMYYLQVDGSLASEYSFSLRLNEAEEVETVLDASTLAFCQNNPSKCGITDDVIVSDTKILCAENPSACGIQEVKTITAEDINNLESGWHLVGTSQAITDLGVFDTAKVVWAWSNGWKLYSPVQSIQETIAISLSYTSLDQIDAQKGFWILKE